MSRRARKKPAEPAPPAPNDPQIPLFEFLPAFEEEGGPTLDPSPVARALLDERSAPGQQCRLLATRLRALGRDKRLRRIGVVGAGRGEGSTTVALGLARALAHDHHLRVLLVDLDLRRPALEEELGLDPPAVGLRGYLEGKSEIPVLRRSRPAGFWVLSAGAGATAAETSLASPRLATLLRAADRVFDYVVADSPPLLEGGDATLLQGHLDGFVFVVRSRNAQRETIRRAATLVRPGLMVGVVLNAQRDFLRRR